MDWAITVASSQVQAFVLGVNFVNPLNQFLRCGENEIRRAPHVTSSVESGAPTDMRLVAYDQITIGVTELFCRSLYNQPLVARNREAIDNGPEFHIPKVFMIPKLVCQNDRPAQSCVAIRYSQASELRIVRGVQGGKAFGVPHGDE
jgi:hypothetical protein